MEEVRWFPGMQQGLELHYPFLLDNSCLRGKKLGNNTDLSRNQQKPNSH